MMRDLRTFRFRRLPRRQLVRLCEEAVGKPLAEVRRLKLLSGFRRVIAAQEVYGSG